MWTAMTADMTGKIIIIQNYFPRDLNKVRTIHWQVGGWQSRPRSSVGTSLADQPVHRRFLVVSCSCEEATHTFTSENTYSALFFTQKPSLQHYSTVTLPHWRWRYRHSSGSDTAAVTNLILASALQTFPFPLLSKGIRYFDCGAIVLYFS